MKISQNSQENTSARVSLLIKLQTWGLKPYLKEFQIQAFSCELYNIFKNTFFIEHLHWLLLKARSYLEFSSETAIQRFLKNCWEVSEKWQDEFIKRVCLLLVSLLKGRQRLRLFPDNISKHSNVFLYSLHVPFPWNVKCKS